MATAIPSPPGRGQGEGQTGTLRSLRFLLLKSFRLPRFSICQANEAKDSLARPAQSRCEKTIPVTSGAIGYYAVDLPEGTSMREIEGPHLDRRRENLWWRHIPRALLSEEEREFLRARDRARYTLRKRRQ